MDGRIKMKVNEKYEVHICVIDMTDNISGDVYTDFAEYMNEIGGSYEFGFLIIDSATGFVRIGHRICMILLKRLCTILQSRESRE